MTVIAEKMYFKKSITFLFQKIADHLYKARDDDVISLKPGNNGIMEILGVSPDEADFSQNPLGMFSFVKIVIYCDYEIKKLGLFYLVGK